MCSPSLPEQTVDRSEGQLEGTSLILSVLRATRGTCESAGKARRSSARAETSLAVSEAAAGWKWVVERVKHTTKASVGMKAASQEMGRARGMVRARKKLLRSGGGCGLWVCVYVYEYVCMCVCE